MKKMILGMLATTLTLSVAFASEGPVTSKVTKDGANIFIFGQAAKEIRAALTKAPQTKGMISSVIGKNIICTSKILEGGTATNCRFLVGSDGLIEHSKIDTVLGNDTGKATITAGKNSVSIAISGKAASQILKAMSAVSDHGTMTTSKDSGDIRCSSPREFSSGNAVCIFKIDAYGSASSK